MKSALTLWANLEATRDDSSMTVPYIFKEHSPERLAGLDYKNEWPTPQHVLQP